MAGPGDVRDRVVFVTGAARGIGLETARQLAARCARVALADIDGHLALKEAEALGIGSLGIQCDVTNRTDVDAAVEYTIDRFGRLDVVVPNAGIGCAGALTSIPDRDFERVVAVNLGGAWNTVRSTLPHLVATRGYLLMIASAWSFMNGVGVGAYPVTKAAVEAMGRALRVELAPRGVDVGIAYFGFVDTDLVRTAFAHPGMVEWRKALPGFVVKPIPVERAAAAMVASIERRAPRVSAPGWIAPGLALRGLLAYGDGRLARNRHVRKAVGLLRERPTT
jgi:NAD(P)-dependent dehydrogenase (short-subunit alcohol dehydrogenase family)